MRDILARETKPLMGNKSILKQPDLVKVQTIKKKYLEQIPEARLTYDDSFLDLEMIILGRCGQTIIYSDQSKTLKKMEKIDFIQYYAEEKVRGHGADWTTESRTPIAKQYLKEAGDLWDKAPVLFED